MTSDSLLRIDGKRVNSAFSAASVDLRSEPQWPLNLPHSIES